MSNGIWQQIKDWFTPTTTEPKKPKSKPEKPKIKSSIKSISLRKKRNNVVLSKKEVSQIRKFYKNKDDYGVKNFADFTKLCNSKLSLNKSRSVYCRIINGVKPYTYS